MQTHSLVSPRILLAALCVSLASCSTPPSTSPGIEAPPPPDYVSTPGNTTPATSNPRLTIESGEGEPLNLPWFVRDTQDAINR